MRRDGVEPRPDWRERVERIGFDFHTIAGRTYWDESAVYTFESREIGTLKAAAEELHARCLEAVDHVIRHRLYHRVGVPAGLASLMERSRESGQEGHLGRFDFSWDGSGPPKMLEYNADTPTTLPEAAEVQRRWLADKFPGHEGFNTLREALGEAWRAHRGERVHFCTVTGHHEDRANLQYQELLAHKAGVDTGAGVMPMGDIGWDRKRRQFVDMADRPMRTICKLYPWEWLLREPFAVHVAEAGATWIEPPWKAILTSKGLLPLLWELFPGHPNLLPAFDSPHPLHGDFAKKPVLSREGANVTLVKHDKVLRTEGGRYGAEGFIWQALCELPDFDGNRPVLGVWMVGGRACALSVREDVSPITGPLARFVPHRVC